MRLLRLRADADGGSYFAEDEVAMSAQDFAPPAPPVALSAPWAARRALLFRAAAGTDAGWHPTPARQLMVFLSGAARVVAGDGGVRELGPGSAILLEDTTGRGHHTLVAPGEDLVALIVQLE